MSNSELVNFQQEANPPDLSKTISLLYAFSLTFGTIVGTGIFMSVKDTFNVFKGNSIGIVLLFWFLAGVISILGGLCYTELATRIPESGGERAYFKIALNQKFSVTFVIMCIFVVRAISIAAMSLTASEYLVTIVDSGIKYPLIEKLLSLAIILLCFIINCISKKVANAVGVLFTICKSVALLIVIVSGIYSFATEEAPEWQTAFDTTGFNLTALGECWVALFWAFEGWNTLGLIAGDMKNLSRDLPRAITGGVSLVVILYLLAVVSYSAVLGFETVRNSSQIAVFVAHKMLKQGYPILPILISFSAIGGVNADLFVSSSVIVSASIDGELPKLFSLVHYKRRTSIISLISLTLCSFVFLFLDFNTLIGYCAFLSWFFYFLAFLCLWKVKLSDTRLTKNKIFKVPFFVIVPLQIVCVFVVIMAFFLRPIGCTIIAIVLVVVFCLQYIPRELMEFPILTRFNENLINKLETYCYLSPATRQEVS